MVDARAGAERLRTGGCDFLRTWALINGSLIGCVRRATTQSICVNKGCIVPRMRIFSPKRLPKIGSCSPSISILEKSWRWQELRWSALYFFASTTRGLHSFRNGSKQCWRPMDRHSRRVQLSSLRTADIAYATCRSLPIKTPEGRVGGFPLPCVRESINWQVSCCGTNCDLSLCGENLRER